MTNAIPISTGPGATILKVSPRDSHGRPGFRGFPTIAGTFDTTSGGFADVFVNEVRARELGTRNRCPDGYLAFTDGTDALSVLS